MRTLKFIDMTLRQAGPSFGKELSFKEKLEIARSLDRLKADTIELAPISGSRADQLANRTIASMAVTRISAAVDISVGNIEETWESVRPAKKPKLNTVITTCSGAEGLGIRLSKKQSQNAPSQI
jgi:2-isopropylmalate synthase